MSVEPGSSTSETLSAVIIGSGFAGLCMAIKLKQAGIHDFVILERGSEIGGTWRDNSYPGCACDVQSHLYSFSFEPNPEWSRMFAPQAEIQAYLLRVVEKYGLRPHVRLHQNVIESRYDEDSATWTVRTAAGQTHRGRALVSGTGGLSNPAYPKLKGLDTFKGHAFHSAKWDHAYDLKGKRVAVIGTGASAIQFVPAIVDQVVQLKLFQRSAPWVISKPDRPITNFERDLFKAVPFTQKLFRNAIYWGLEGRVLGFLHPSLMKLVERWGHDHIAKQIQDPELRRKVTPNFSIGCKRILMSDTYYPALTREHVDVVTDAIVEVREHSILTADGREHAIDTIIYGTGFEVLQMVPKNTVFGVQGRDITAEWPNGGPKAYKGTSFAGFPNYFMIMGPNTALGHSSVVYMIESQVGYIMQAIKGMREKGWKSLDVKPEKQEAYNRELDAKHSGSVWLSGCKSWYLDEKSGRNIALWPSFTFNFRKLLARFEEADYVIAERDESKVAAHGAAKKNPSVNVEAAA